MKNRLTDSKISRRTFLATGSAAGAALVLGFYIRRKRRGYDDANAFKPNAWLRITRDGNITVLVEIPEMGQGPRTVDTMMLADELEAEWSRIRVEQAPVIPQTYKKLGTGGSGGTMDAWAYMRKVGAQAREMLIAAAMQRWRAARQECRAESGSVVHAPTGRRLTYGELVETASRLPVARAEDVPLKSERDFCFIGKAAPRVDIPPKADGRAAFGIDVRLPGMLFAVIARPPQFGATLKAFDPTEAKSLPGVRAIFPVPPLTFLPGINRNANVAGGVAVVADSTWTAIQARRALKITWEKAPQPDESTEGLRKRLQEAVTAPPALIAVSQGDVAKAVQSSRRVVEATYELPFQAHATLEPMNTTVHVRDDGIEVWSPTQIGDLVQRGIAGLAGVPLEKVTVHMMLCGGSFGRRYQYDYFAEAWQVARQVKAPVQLLWTREDDMQHDFYRQYSYHHLAGAVGPGKTIAAWSHRIVSTPIRPVFDTPERLKDPQRVAMQELGGAELIAYQPENFVLDYVPVNSPVPRAWWRSVSDSFNAFAVECFVDELAHSVGEDPYLFRMRLLGADRQVRNQRRPQDKPLDTRRFRDVLRVAAEKSGWGKQLPPGHGLGIACHYSFDGYIAHVAEVSVDRHGAARVHRVVSAVDCGLAVNPDGVRAMTEGGVHFALTPVLTGEITIRDSIVEQDNFDGYQVLRINDAPDVEVHILDGGADPGGMGETAVPPLAPAVANAVFAATGKRIRRLPIDPALLAKENPTP